MEGFKKKLEIFTQRPPPLREGKVGNLFKIFFSIQESNLRCLLTQLMTLETGEKGVQSLFWPLKAHKKAQAESILLYIPLQNKKWNEMKVWVR